MTKGVPEHLGAAARHAKITARQIEDLCYGLSCKEIQKLRNEAADLDLTLPQYLREVIRHRPKDLIRETVVAERPEVIAVEGAPPPDDIVAR
jgi:hypothetical protein